MIREHVLLALSLLLGMLFIIDLYIAAVYINTWNTYKKKSTTGRESKRNLPMRYNTLPGLVNDESPDFQDMENTDVQSKDYGLNLENLPENAIIFKYYFYPYQGHLSILIPGERLREIDVSESDVLNYVVRHIMYNMKMEDFYFLRFSDIPVKTGHIWVRKAVLKSLAKKKQVENFLLGGNNKRRKRKSLSFLLQSTHHNNSSFPIEFPNNKNNNYYYNYYFKPGEYFPVPISFPQKPLPHQINLIQ